MATCEQLCSSISSDKICKTIARSDIATYLVTAISIISAIICFVLSLTQLKSADGMVDACTHNDVIQPMLPFSVSGTMQSGTECYGYCSWSSKNTSLRFVSLSIFIIVMIGMLISMKKMKFIWLSRILLFITLTLLFTTLVTDCSSLIAGKEVCDNNFEVTVGSETYAILTVQCDNEIIEIDSCSLEPYIRMVFADSFTVFMCGVLWQLMAYYKALHAQLQEGVNEVNNSTANVMDVPITTKNQSELSGDGGEIPTNKQHQKPYVSPMNAYEEY